MGRRGTDHLRSLTSWQLPVTVEAHRSRIVGSRKICSKRASPHHQLRRTDKLALVKVNLSLRTMTIKRTIRTITVYATIPSVERL